MYVKVEQYWTQYMSLRDAVVQFFYHDRLLVYDHHEVAITKHITN